MIKGITIQLVTKVQDGTDPFGEPIYKESTVNVDDVLVGQPTTDDITESLELFGKRVEYTLAIPKGDSHEWTDAEVILPAPFYGRYRTFGFPTAGIEANIPLRWNKKVKLERYGEECSV
jgi:hypothetical protein